MKNVIINACGQECLTFYLAMEEYLAGKMAEDVFFVWQSGPTVIVGRNQILENEVNIDYCKRYDVDIVRRKSGGGCVYSDRGNIMISCICRRSDVASAFDRYLSSLTDCLCNLGLPAEKSGRNDILIEGRKVSGNAFQQLPDRSIVHGTLLYSTDMHALENAIMPPVEKLERHGVDSVRQRVMNIADYAGMSGLTHDALKSIGALKTYLADSFCDGTITLNDDDIAKIRILEREYFKL